MRWLLVTSKCLGALDGAAESSQILWIPSVRAIVALKFQA
jgi:hypothetical protein